MTQIKLPVTRYYGSKRKIVQRIWNEINSYGLEFNSVLDVFGGSGIFSYFCKVQGKKVIYNDIFSFNCLIAKALIQSNKNLLTMDEALSLLEVKSNFDYKSIITDNYSGIYYHDFENRLIDRVIQNIENFLNVEKRPSAYYLLFQTCIIKRPYNLFHRKNLNLRQNFTSGNFGNKITWERSFEELFIRFNHELDRFCFDNGHDNIVINSSALNCTYRADLIYIDPPYLKNNNNVTYHNKYHFLEGLANYDFILTNIDNRKNNKVIDINKNNEFESKNKFISDFDQLIFNHRDSIIVMSYRNNGYPTINNLCNILDMYKNNVIVIDLGKYNYALNKNNKLNTEVIILAF